MRGKVDSGLMAQHIGQANGKDAGNNKGYGAGEECGKGAKCNGG